MNSSKKTVLVNEPLNEPLNDLRECHNGASSFKISKQIFYLLKQLISMLHKTEAASQPRISARGCRSE